MGSHLKFNLIEMKKTFKLAAMLLAMAAMASCSSNSKATDSAADSTNVADTAAAMAPADAPEGAPEDGPMDGPKDGPHGEPNANDMIQHRVDEMAEELNLTDDQKQKVVDLLTANVPTNDAKCDGQKPDPENMKKAREEEEAKLKEILTSEQYTKYQELQKEHGHHGPEGHGHGPKPGEGPAPK